MYDYALVHVFYTIPVAILLTVVLLPLFTRLDVYKICFLVTVAFTYTLPWDSYLVRTGIWTYPSYAVLGPSLFAVPIEELFFFVIQTYITTCLQILLNKPVLTAAYLSNEDGQVNPKGRNYGPRKRIGQLFFAACFFLPMLIEPGSTGTYMKLIVTWVAPIFFMLWSFAYQLLMGLPRSKTWLPIALPTLFLWIVDTLALHRGTWSIVSGTKLGLHLWPHLDVEEALFFFVTNTMIVWGSCAFDTAIAILDAFPDHFPHVPGTPSPAMKLKALFLSTTEYDQKRLNGLSSSLNVLSKKSRSFYLASGVFTGRLRIDLILLYGFCRVADDLIDDAPDAKEAQLWISRFTAFLDVMYSEKRDETRLKETLQHFPADAQLILRLLPVEKLPSKPLYDLLDGFRMDLRFLDKNSRDKPPIQTENDLELYATCVAATIGELCLSLVYYHNPDKDNQSQADKNATFAAGVRMGRVLQYVNIVRDVTTDAQVDRCYIPHQWFKTAGKNTSTEAYKQEILRLRTKILEMAFEEYAKNRDAIEALPSYARGGIRVAVESYMEIGREMRKRIKAGLPLDFAGGGKKGRASVPKLRRVWVGWRTMAGWRGSV